MINPNLASSNDALTRLPGGRATEEEIAQSRGRDVGPRLPLTLLTALTVGGVLAGTLQGPILTATHVAMLNSVDDLLLLAAVLCALTRLRRAPATLALGVILWIVLSVTGFIFRATTQTYAFTLSRQVLIPVGLMIVGATLSHSERRVVLQVGLLVAAANGIYVLIEACGVRLIDPNFAAQSTGVYIDRGLPGYYYGYNLSNSPVIRAGGLVLNPPTAGIVTAGGAVLAIELINSRRIAYAISATLVLATIMTGSRSGLVIVFAGVLLPYLLKPLGPLAGSVLATALTGWLGLTIAQTGNSVAHAAGLLGGLQDAITWPMGRGYGYAGDQADQSIVQSTESLAGIAFSASGLLAVLLVGLLLLSQARRVFLAPGNRFAGVGLGIVVASLFAESASALSGTAIVWIMAGVAFVHDSPA